MLDSNSHFGAAESFCAPDDVAANETAAAVFDGCSDVFHGYELWRSEELLARVMQKRCTGDGETRLSDEMLKHQRVVLDLADRLRSTFSGLEASRRLLEMTAAMREQVGKSVQPTTRGEE